MGGLTLCCEVPFTSAPLSRSSAMISGLDTSAACWSSVPFGPSSWRISGWWFNNSDNPEISFFSIRPIAVEKLAMLKNPFVKRNQLKGKKQIFDLFV